MYYLHTTIMTSSSSNKRNKVDNAKGILLMFQHNTDKLMKSNNVDEIKQLINNIPIDKIDDKNKYPIIPFIHVLFDLILKFQFETELLSCITFKLAKILQYATPPSNIEIIELEYFGNNKSLEGLKIIASKCLNPLITENMNVVTNVMVLLLTIVDCMCDNISLKQHEHLYHQMDKKCNLIQCLTRIN
jgi:hypothetical protein